MAEKLTPFKACSRAADIAEREAIEAARRVASIDDQLRMMRASSCYAEILINGQYRALIHAISEAASLRDNAARLRNWTT